MAGRVLSESGSSVDRFGAMLSILSPEPAALEAPGAAIDDGTSEFELVVGRRQLASLGFVLLVLLATFSGGSYLAGQAAARRVVAATPTVPADPIPVVQATIAPVVAPPAEPPLLAEPVTGAIYIQMGAVDKGIAIVFAEGLRKRGFDAFVATGPSPTVFRVLIGPFRNAESYQHAKDDVTNLGLTTFARRYEN